MTQQQYTPPVQNTQAPAQQGQQRAPRPYFSLYFPKNTTGQDQTMTFRVLHNNVGEFYQTTTHLVFFEKQGGGKGTIRVECAKGGTYGTVREGIHCPLDATERYQQKTKQWFWVQDMEDGKLKYLEATYGVRQQLETMQQTMLRGEPLSNAVFTLVKGKDQSGRVAYQVVPDLQYPVEPFDLYGFLASIGLESLPALVGEKDFPPIWKLTSEQLNDVAQGIMPWQKQQTAYNPATGGTAQPAYQPVQQTTAPAYQPVQQPGTTNVHQPQNTHLYQPQNTHQINQPIEQPVQQVQPPVQQFTQPVQQETAPVLQPVQSGETFQIPQEPPLNAYTPNVEGVPYTAEGGQQLENSEGDFVQQEDTTNTPSFF